MKTFQWIQMLMGMSLLLLVGCVERTPPVFQEIGARSPLFSLPQRIEDLAGPWEYQDAEAQGTMTLNAVGMGSYDWEEGRLETLSLENGIWTGKWIQEGNDREGGFKLTFSNDSPEAQGDWWYTRIGKDHDPFQPGGTFRMARPSTIQPAP